MSNIATMPFDILIKEGESQRDRHIKEVMDVLFALLPCKNSDNLEPSFLLSDGTKCWIKAFFFPLSCSPLI